MYKRRTALGTVIFGAILIGCNNNLPTSDSTDPTPNGDEQIAIRYPNDNFPASFARLFAHKDEYHGKHIRLEGFLRVAFEGDSIYYSKDHADHLMTSEAFWVSFDETKLGVDRNGLASFDRKWVLLEGTFDKDNHGHLGAYSGAIENVDRLELQKKWHDD